MERLVLKDKTKAMKRFDKLEVPEDRYLKYIDIQTKNNTQFREQVHGARKNLYVHGRLVASTVLTNSLVIGKLEKKNFSSFLGRFNKHLYSQFLKKPELYQIYIKFTGAARGRNQKLWKTLPPGSIFYNIDLRSAYWQAAHKLGYIDKKMYEKYIELDEYKEVKRFCISFLARPNKMIYDRNTPNQREIHCDIRPLLLVYKNIRHYLYNTITDIESKCKNCLEYNIDGITILRDDLKTVKEYFQQCGLIYKTTVCFKISDTEYRYGSRIKNFKKK